MPTTLTARPTGTSEGPLPAVRGVDLVVRAGEVVGVAGESGCGKSTLASTVLRLQPKDADGHRRGPGLGRGRRSPWSWGDLRALRWAEASIVFQGALHSLNPVQRVGDQIAEPIRLHEPGLPDERVEERVRELLEQVGLPPARGPRLPAPALRRAAPAGDDRDGAGLPPAADRRRRADHRPRRDGPGADPRPALGAGARARRRADDHQPRPVGAGRRLRPGRW